MEADEHGNVVRHTPERVLAPVMHLEFVNADRIAAQRRQQLLSQGRSFMTETVFSHPSKLELMTTAKDRGYRVHLHVVLIPEELSVARVASRVEHGGRLRPSQSSKQQREAAVFMTDVLGGV